MTQAKSGDTVKVAYTGKLDDGTVFDSTENREPLEFTVGAGQLIKGFDEAVAGMSPGDSKTVELPPEEAYGPRRDEMVLAIDRERMPADSYPQVGQQLQLTRQDGQPVPATITEVTESNVTVDANHPLAGRQLTFEIELLELA